MAKEKRSSLNKEVIITLGSVVLFLGVGCYLWLPNLVEEGFINNEANNMVHDALRSVLLYVYVPSVLYCFIVGELSGNLSQVDKLWSVIPAVFSWYITLYESNYNGLTLNPKSVLMSFLVTLWGLRLTVKFLLRGGYSLKFWAGEEDYRWVYVRDRLPVLKNSRFLMGIFNLGFISIYQLFLIFAFSGGVLIGAMATRYQRSVATHKSHEELNNIDIVLAMVMFCLICLGTLADSQQQTFQCEKYKRIDKKMPLYCSEQHYEIGFATNGLFAYSRHPNFACEQAIWLVFYMFTIDFQRLKLFEVGGLLNASIIGVLLLVVVFTQSTSLTEDISAGKYPLYKEYQKNVGRFVDVKLILQKLVLCRSPDRQWVEKK